MVEPMTTTTVADAINAAIASGTSNFQLVVVGVISIAAVGLAMRLILGAMKS